MSLPALVLLHGANGCAAELETLALPLREYARVLVPDLPGHGGRPIPERLSIEGVATDVIALLEREGLERAFFVGYSLGGYAALYLARHHPSRTLGACAIATKLALDATTVERWVYLAQPARLARPGNPRAGELLRAHGSDWPKVTLANAAFFADLGRRPELTDADLAAIERPVLLVNSNRDSIVGWDETVQIGTRVPGARLVMFYGIAHPFRQVPVNPVARAIGAWVAEVAAA
ncbi:MAG: alpha/beta fold hydrolase [Pseudomonadota bacterium]|nr:alpha/beta fold hydrolase [Pseudomonadota bacterium]